MIKKWSLFGRYQYHCCRRYSCLCGTSVKQENILPFGFFYVRSPSLCSWLLEIQLVPWKPLMSPLFFADFVHLWFQTRPCLARRFLGIFIVSNWFGADKWFKLYKLLAWIHVTGCFDSCPQPPPNWLSLQLEQLLMFSARDEKGGK